MRCPFCHHTKTKVVDSREAGPETRRRRQCLDCDKRFTTFERVEQVQKLTVVKKDGSRVPFDKEKIRRGVEKSCYKRPVAVKLIAAVVDEVEEQLFLSGREEVSTEIIGNFVADRLKTIDSVSYVRFASVYRDFRDIDDLGTALEELREAKNRRGRDQGQLF